MPDSTDPTAEIVDVVPAAIRVYADAIVKGDSLFDSLGYAHKLDAAVAENHKIILVRDDGWTDRFDPWTEVTIQPAAHPGRAIDSSSSVSRQHFIDTGRYLTVDEAAAYAVAHPTH